MMEAGSGGMLEVAFLCLCDDVDLHFPMCTQQPDNEVYTCKSKDQF